MGQVQDKCSCLFKRDDQSTFTKFDSAIVKEENNGQSPLITTKAKSFKEKMMRNRNNDESFKMKIYDDDSISLSKNKVMNSVASYSFAEVREDPVQHKAIAKVQKVIKGYLLRKKWSEIKNSLTKAEIDLIDKYQRSFKTATLLKAEIEANSAYDPNGWTKFYDEESTLFNFDYQKVFNVKLFIYDKVVYYIGSMNLKGEKHGQGELVNKNGVKYEGFWRNNNFTGWGRMIDSEGVVYEGYFQNMILNGKGERINPKSYYKGDFKNGLRDGLGEEETPEHSYVGEYSKDKKHGNGKLVYKKIKDVYEGEFTENNITGYGFYIWSNQDTFKGTFLGGKMHGRGVYKWPDGGEYNGEYTNNIKEGHGRFKWSNGKIFEGPFKSGKPNGHGKLIYGDTNVDVEFRNGKLVKSNNADNADEKKKPSSKKMTSAIP